jgi:DNA (cytosine-5)-methyltransferase 1
MSKRTMHLFAGIGGGLLADLILGHTPVVAVEWEPYACKVLRERAAEGWFPGLHVWEGDVRLFDPSEYAGVVDCIHAGFPCQDISVAGKQAGVSEGTRSGLYREVLRIADIVRPKQLFLENVAAILSNGLGTVLGDLAALGYDARWLCIRASDVGAPHHRDRWFLLADANGKRTHGGGAWSEQDGRDELADGCFDVANTNNGLRQLTDKTVCAGWDAVELGGEDVADTECQRLPGSWESEPTKHPETPANWQAAQSFNGGESDFWRVEPGLGRVANGIPNRVGQLKGYGNAQVPLQAATAYRLLGGQ